MKLLLRIVRSALRRWYLWTLLPLLTGAAIFGLSSRMPSSYLSSATLYLNLPTDESLSITGSAFKQHEVTTYFQNLIELLYSARTTDRIRLLVFRDFLDGERVVINTVRPQWVDDSDSLLRNRIEGHLSQISQLNLSDTLDARINAYLNEQGCSRTAISDQLSAFRKGNSNYLTLSVTADNAFKAAYLNEVALQSLIQIHQHLNRTRISADQQLFEQLVENARQELNAKVAELERFKITHTVINMPEHTKAIVNQIVDLERQHAKLIETVASRKRALVGLKNRLKSDEELPINIADNERFVALKQSLEPYRAQEFDPLGTSSNNPPNSSFSQTMERAIRDLSDKKPINLEATRRELLKSYLDAKLELEMANELLPVLKKEMARMKQYASRFAPLESTIGTLEREIQTAQETFLILINKLNMAKTVAQGTGKNKLVRIDAPSVPLAPEPSKRKLLSVAGAMVVFLLILGMIGLVEFLDRGIWDGEEFETETGVGLAAYFPEPFEDERDELLRSSLESITRAQRTELIRRAAHSSETVKTIGLMAGNDPEAAQRMAGWLAERAKASGLSAEVVDLRIKAATEPEEINPKRPSDNLQLSSWLEQISEELVANQLIFYILPPYNRDVTWQHVQHNLDAIITLYAAGSVLYPVDHRFLNEASSEIWPVLFNIPVDRLEPMTGPLAKKRSGLRNLLKRLSNGQLKSHLA